MFTSLYLYDIGMVEEEGAAASPRSLVRNVRRPSLSPASSRLRLTLPPYFSNGLASILGSLLAYGVSFINGSLYTYQVRCSLRSKFACTALMDRPAPISFTSRSSSSSSV